MIYGQPVGGPDIAADDHDDIGAGQCGTHDAGRLLIPVGPKHEAAGRVRGNNSVSVFRTHSGAQPEVVC